MVGSSKNAPETANPFAEDPVDETAGNAANPYAASGGVYNPVYEAGLSPRPRTVVRLGFVGLMLALVGELSLLGIGYGLFFPVLAFISLIFAFTTAWLGCQDLAAIRAGAMRGEGRTMTRLGVVTGFATVMLVVSRILYFLTVA